MINGNAGGFTIVEVRNATKDGLGAMVRAIIDKTPDNRTFMNESVPLIWIIILNG